MSLVRTWRRIWGLDFPDPAVGQQWRCERNGEIVKVNSVYTSPRGTLFITCAHWICEEPWVSMFGRESWGIGEYYALGLSDWRHRLREEKRVLLPATEMKP